MKSFLLAAFLFLTIPQLKAHPYLDSLHGALTAAKNDSMKVEALLGLSTYYEYMLPDSNIYYATSAINLSQKSNNAIGQFMAFRSMFFGVNLSGNYPKAMDIALNNLRIAEKLPTKSHYFQALAHNDISLVKREMGDMASAMREINLATEEQQQSGIMDGNQFSIYMIRAQIFLAAKQLDSALVYAEKGYYWGIRVTFRQPYIPLAIAVKGNVLAAMGRYAEARHYAWLAIGECERYNNLYIEARTYRDLATICNLEGKADSCIYFGHIALGICQRNNFGDYASNVGQIMARVFESQQMPDSALKYLKVMLAAKDTLFSQARMQQYLLLNFDEAQRQKEITAAKERFNNQIKLYGLLTAAAGFLLLSFILYRNNKQKQRSFDLLNQQKKETDKQKDIAEHALKDLQATQAQLIQSEKMASLGELTAGIAHEIQNPLNFVNNFSEVNLELIQELKSQHAKINNQHGDGLDLDLLNDIEKNLEKIGLHGKRADSIVKGMLQHSHSASGQMEPTDINAMADEYMRIAYHGFRAKEKDFDVRMETQFDSRLGKILVVPQEIGRVLLNIFNNAFYAMYETKKKQGDGYEPCLNVRTEFVSIAGRGNDASCLIHIKDNGPGIPSRIAEKIWQPFYTTKPTGQGTGLGLSLSYDVITNVHGGKINLESREGEYAEFIIQLPIRQND